ncbi:MAG: imidazolonepropionase [Candidatus Marinimicrobia bacterium]|nr:imidazolonepropionase [Candidatus Neomarinimicrobiota bacterium]|tara:strand:+ start:2375 stop:3694 length:1320 start_codon:yes stop_codon:yes gene_type:complete
MIKIIIFLFFSYIYGNNQIPGTDQKRPILLRGGILHTVSGEILEEHDLLFAEGKIVTIDEQIQPSPETDILDIYGKHVIPGFIAGYTRIGLTEISAVKQTNDHSEIGEINPNVRANVAYNPDSDLIPVTRSNGVLIVNSAPSSGRIPGQSSVMEMDGWTWEEATLKHPAALNLNWPSMRFNFRKDAKKKEKAQREEYHNAIREIDQLIRDVRAYHHRKNAKERKAEHKQQSDLRLESMIPFVIFKDPIHIKANDARQIEAAVKWSNKHDLNIVIVGGKDAWMLTEMLVQNNIPVILLGVQVTPRRRFEPIHIPYKIPAILQKTGVHFCISLDPGYPMDGHVRTLPDEAMRAASWGLTKDQALRAITLTAAEILGIDDKVGSLDLGKDATFFIADNEPLTQYNNPTKAFIKGREIDLSDRQKNLWKKYQEKYRRLGKLSD